MKLSDFVSKDAIIAELAATSRDDAINELVDAIIATDVVAKSLRDQLIKQILAREKKGSTGFGKGVAVPHVKHEKIKHMSACIGVSQQGVDFNALDKEPVYSVVLLLSPQDKPDEHLQAMETLFSALQKDTFRKFLRQSTTRDAVWDLIEEMDAQQIQG